VRSSNLQQELAMTGIQTQVLAVARPVRSVIPWIYGIKYRNSYQMPDDAGMRITPCWLTGMF